MHTVGRRSRLRAARHLLVAVVVLALTAGAGWWAGRATLTGAGPGDAADAQLVTAVAAQTTVGRALDLSVTVQQPSQVVAVNLLPGVVTAVHPLDAPVGAGDVLYSVAGVPVRAVGGTTPFYRDLGDGASGQDVTQLQAALHSLGHLSRAPNGRFDAATASAVRSWQRALGQERTGRVVLGELVAVESLPAGLRLGEDIRRGSLLAGGEDAVLASTGERIFSLVLDRAQARSVPTGAAVEVSWQDGVWPAVVSSSAVNGEGYTVLELSGADGTSVCADQCGALPPDPELTLPSRVVVEPPVTGVGVPAAAVRTSADGGAYVVLEAGGSRDVSVRGSSRGVVVVDGLDAGDVVLLAGGS